MIDVLAVDDEAPVLRLLDRVLTSGGYSCSTASSAAEARKTMEKQKCKVVITDIRMPSESGLEFLKFIRSHYPETVVLMISGMSDPGTATTAANFGAYGYITKPFQANEVLVQVMNALSRRKLELENRAYKEKLEALVHERTALLMASERRYRNLMESMMEGLLVINELGHLSFANNRFCSMLGYDRKDLLGSPVAGYLEPSDRSLWKKTFREKESGDSSRLEMAWKKKDGSIIHSLVSPTFLKDESGRLLESVVVVTDISERKQSEERVLEAGQSLDRKVKELSCLYFVSDALDTLSSGMDTTLEKIANIIPRSLRHTDQAYAMIQLGDKVFWGGQGKKEKKAPKVTHARVLFKGQGFQTGSDRENPCRLSRDLVVDKEKKGRIEIGYSRPPSQPGRGIFLQEERELFDQVVKRLEKALEEKFTQKELAEREARFRTLVETMHEGLVVTDRDGVLSYVNRRFSEMLGLGKGNIIGKNIGDFLDDENYLAYRELQEKQTKGSDNAGELVWSLPGGERLCSIASLTPIYSGSGAMEGFFSVVMDITEKKALETRLWRARKLESIGQLAAGIAHEINTPMAFIGNNTRFIKDAFEDLTSLLQDYTRLAEEASNGGVKRETMAAIEKASFEKEMEYLMEQAPQALEQTLEGIDRISEILRSMKRFAHPGSAKKSPTDLNKAVETTVNVAKNEWKYVADVFMDLDRNMPMVPCCSGEINQMLLNLIVNGAHAISEKGAPERGKISIRTQRKSRWAEIRVRDTGAGIPEEVRPRIFDPFFTTKQEGQGTGQGLAIAHTVVVEKHDGIIDFETETGKGTTFVVRLPLIEEGTHVE